MSLQHFSNFNQISQQFRTNRQQYKQMSNQIQTYVKDNTVDEKKAIEEAIEKYNNKIQSILKDKEDDIKVIEHYNESMQETLKETYDAFNKGVEYIMKDEEMSEEDKMEKIKEMSEYIMTNLYTKEEMEEFKKFANNFVVIVPNNIRGYSSERRPIGDANEGEDESLSIEYI